MGRHKERTEFINSINFKNKAKKQFKKLNTETQKEVAKSLGMLIVPTLMPLLNIKRLKGKGKRNRLRVGKYRILFTIEKSVIDIYAINHRKDAYKF